MKLCRAFLVVFLLLPLQSLAQDTISMRMSEFSLAPIVGTDIGGAIPVPMSGIGGMNAYPRLNLSLGARFNVNFKRHWNVSGEIVYKTVAMDADARVINQKFKGENMLQFFTGVADMHMSFTMLEMPLYMTYMFGNRRQHGIILGAYASVNFNSEFSTLATKGFIGNEADKVDSELTEPMLMDFTSQLSSWDAGLIVGYDVRMFPRINMGLRVSMGCKDIFLRGSDFFDYKMYQMRGSVVLSYDILRFGRFKSL